jgi:hypothetical protein
MKIPKPRIPFRKKEEKKTGNSGKCEICKTTDYGLICIPDHKRKMRELFDEIMKASEIADEKKAMERLKEIERTIG